MKQIILFILITSFSLQTFSQFTSDSLKIFISDEQNHPIPGVILLQLPESYLIGTTDENGSLILFGDQLLQLKHILCQHLSYQNFSTSFESLRENPKIIPYSKIRKPKC